jgi:hypothetical protein
VASSPIRRFTPGFEVRNRETLGSLQRAYDWALISILARCGPSRQGFDAWVAVLSRSRQSPSNTPSRHALGLEHHGCAQLLQSIGAASRSIGGLTLAVAEPPLRVPNSHGRPTPSLPPVHRRSSSPSSSSPSEGLQSIGGLLPESIRVFMPLTITHHPRSNEAGPLAPQSPP